MSKTDVPHILIVEDEMIIASRIALLLQRMGYAVAGILPRGEEVLDHCRASLPDLILMDIHLSGAIDGVETVRELQQAGFDLPVVYLTANTDKATFERARTTRPEGFVGKPYRRRELEMTLALAFSRRDEHQTDIVPSHVSPLPDRMFIRHQNRMIRLPYDEVLFIEAARAYCKVVTTKGQHVLSLSMGALESELPDQFVRVHRSYVVNLRMIDEISSDEILLGGRSVTLGRSYREELLRRLKMI